MSSLAVRQTVETWLKDPAMTVPYFATINEEQNPGVLPWCTADFDAYEREILTMCGDEIRERGIIEIVYFGQAGQGDDILLAAIESDMQTLMAQRDPTGALVIINRSAPLEYSNGDADQYYASSIELDYLYLQ